jgi:hypothetical protein
MEASIPRSTIIARRPWLFGERAADRPHHQVRCDILEEREWLHIELNGGFFFWTLKVSRKGGRRRDRRRYIYTLICASAKAFARSWRPSSALSVLGRTHSFARASFLVSIIIKESSSKATHMLVLRHFTAPAQTSCSTSNLLRTYDFRCSILYLSRKVDERSHCLVLFGFRKATASQDMV